MPLQDALKARLDGTLLDHPALARCALRTPRPCPSAPSPPAPVAAAGLWDWAAGIEDPAAARADIARLIAEAEAWDALPADLTLAAGFHGRGAASFLGWLAAQTDKDFDRRPDPDGWSSEGIEITTWHRAKGREWPVTIVADLGHDWGERGNSLRAEFTGFDDLDDVLSAAALSATPRFAAKEQTDAFLAARSDACEAEACRLLYVALTRARDRLVLALPPEGKTEKTDLATVLRSRCGLAVGDGEITLAGRSFPARITPAPGAMPSVFDDAPGPTMTPDVLVGLPGRLQTTIRTPWRSQPSSLSGTLPHTGRLRHVDLGPRVGGSADGFALATDRGTAWHLAFRTLAQRPDLAARLGPATGLDRETLDAIAAQAAAVTAWLRAEGFPELSFELPVQITAPDGSEINGVIDCLASGPRGPSDPRPQVRPGPRSCDQVRGLPSRS